MAATLAGLLLPVNCLEIADVTFYFSRFQRFYERGRAGSGYIGGWPYLPVNFLDFSTTHFPAFRRRLGAAHGQVQVRVAPCAVALVRGVLYAALKLI